MCGSARMVLGGLLIAAWASSPACDCGGNLARPVPRCGDGVVEGIEVCDEGDLNGTGEGHCVSDCATVQACGNEALEGTEVCDRGAANNDAWSLTPGCNTVCSGPGPFCGDGTAQGSEACDDGAENGNYDRCKTDCSGSGPHCGDDVVQSEHETCEPGLGDPCDGCVLDCSSRAGEAVCGDGVVCTATEACDDHFHDNCGSCNATCTDAGTGSICGDGNLCPETEVCDPGPDDPCNTCVPGCTAPGGGTVCGDNKVCSATEVCDDGDTISNGNGQCVADCSAIQLCGNGTLEGTETCDDGNTADCVGNCRGDCSTTVAITGCGDHVVCPPEQCDDGRNGDPCDGCLDDCTVANPSPGPTSPPGVIDANTVWYAVQSPFSLFQDLVILQGVHLIVCRGTHVTAADGTDVSVLVRGLLDVRGTNTEPVIFTADASNPTPGAWQGIEVELAMDGKASLAGAVVEYAAIGLLMRCCNENATATVVADSTFRRNEIAISGRNIFNIPLSVENSAIVDNRVGADGDSKEFHNCVFSGNAYAAFEIENSRFDGCTVTSNDVGLYGGKGPSDSFLGVVEHCLIADNTGNGIQAWYQGFELVGNTIVRNGIGVTTNNPTSWSGPPPPINRNTLCDNLSHDVELLGPFTVQATSNWWCTTDPEDIKTRVWDVYDDSNLGQVTFQPFLTAPPPEAPAP